MNTDSKIYVAGHNGMVGSAIVNLLKSKGFINIIYKSSSELDLRDQTKVNIFFEKEKPEYVFLAAAKVGGIKANNDKKADFLYNNLMIQSNIIHASYVNKVKKLLFLGSSCIYPKNSTIPITEDQLLNGKLELTNEAYAIAKISGIKMCQYYSEQYGCNFISAMPTNLYGDNDNYDLETSHVLPAMLKKFYLAKANGNDFVELWGTGKPKREFLHTNDLADACLFLMENYNDTKEHINVGYGEDISIEALSNIIKGIVGYTGDVKWDSTKPDGTYRKLMDSTKLFNMGWKPKINLRDGIQEVFMKNF